MNLHRLALDASSASVTLHYLDRGDIRAAATAAARFSALFLLAFALGEAGAAAVLVCGHRAVCRYQIYRGALRRA